MAPALAFESCAYTLMVLERYYFLQYVTLRRRKKGIARQKKNKKNLLFGVDVCKQLQKINILSVSVPEKLGNRSESYNLSSFLHNPKSGNNSTFHYNWQSRQMDSAVVFGCSVICFFWVIISGKSCAILSRQFKKRMLQTWLTHGGLADTVKEK